VFYENECKTKVNKDITPIADEQKRLKPLFALRGASPKEVVIVITKSPK